jgi:hypothetical protein
MQCTGAWRLAFEKAATIGTEKVLTPILAATTAAWFLTACDNAESPTAPPSSLWQTPVVRRCQASLESLQAYPSHPALLRPTSLSTKMASANGELQRVGSACSFPAGCWCARPTSDLANENDLGGSTRLDSTQLGRFGGDSAKELRG